MVLRVLTGPVAQREGVERGYSYETRLPNSARGGPQIIYKVFYEADGFVERERERERARLVCERNHALFIFISVRLSL